MNLFPKKIITGLDTMENGDVSIKWFTRTVRGVAVQKWLPCLFGLGCYYKRRKVGSMYSVCVIIIREEASFSKHIRLRDSIRK